MDHSSSSRPSLRFAAAVFAVGLATGFGMPRAIGQVSVDSPLAASQPSKDVPKLDAEVAAKLQAARIRYGRLAQNFPDQFTHFEARVKEIDRLLRQSLPETAMTRKEPLIGAKRVTAITTKENRGGPVTENFDTTNDKTKVATTRTSQPATVAVKVDHLKDLARRIHREATLISSLTEQSEDGLTVALRRTTEAWLRSLDNLLKTNTKIETTAQR